MIYLAAFLFVLFIVGRSPNFGGSGGVEKPKQNRPPKGPPPPPMNGRVRVQITDKGEWR